MRKVLSTALATTLLFFIGCKKTDISAEADSKGLKETARVSSLVATTPTCDVINFTNASGFVTSVTSQNGMVVEVESHNPYYPSEAEAAVILNSGSPHWEDPDLGTPNVMYPGGVGLPSGAASNNTALGNIIVIQDFEYAAPNDEDINDPGGFIEFIFPSLISPTSIQVIDVGADESEGGTVELLGASGNVLATIPIPITGSNGVANINLGSRTDVKAIRLNILGSMGFDNLQFCVPPPPTSNGCTYTQGYWKTHGPGDCAKGNNTNMWPQPIRTSGVTIGSYTYSPSAMCTIFNTPVKGTNLGLAHQLFAAMLNSAKNGGAPTAVQTCINNAIAFLANNGGAYGSVSSNQLKAQRDQLNTCLTNYNEGNHCK